MCISGLLWNCLNRFLNVGRIDSENLKYQTPRGLCKSGGCSCKVSAIYIFPERISEGRIQSLLYSHVYSTFNLIKTRSSSNKKNIKLAILDQTCILKISEWRLQAFQVFFFTGGGGRGGRGGALYKKVLNFNLLTLSKMSFSALSKKNEFFALLLFDSI